MRLKADPLAIFANDKSPLGLHVRTRWMAECLALAADVKGCITTILTGQSGDGSWRGSVPGTIQNLFSLWLLARRPDEGINAALDWLLEVKHPPMRYACNDGATYDNLFFRTTRSDRAGLRKPSGVPFTSGCSGFVKTGAALFFAAQFGRADDDRVWGAYRSLDRTAQVRHGRLCCGSCANNILLAFAAHPHFGRSKGMAAAVAYLSHQQKPTGEWGRGVPLFPTFFIVSHLQSRNATSQFESALRRIQRMQNRDGTWGRTQKALWTFLVLDSLERKQVDWEV